MSVDRHAVALVLSEIATLLELNGENRFKVRAYAQAARAVEALEQDLAGLVAAGELSGVPGIGPATRSVVEELVRAGRSSYHERLLERTPSGLFELLRVPGLGPGRIHRLHQELGVETVADLARAAAEGRVAALRGFGERSQSKILEGIAFLRGTATRRLLPHAYEAAARIIGALEGRDEVRALKLAGPLRRRLETVDGVDLIAAAKADRAPLLEAFLSLPGLTGAERSDDGARARLGDGFEVRLRCVPAAALPAAWIHATGSAAHVGELEERARELGLELRAEGLYRGGRRVRTPDEEAVYRRLGLEWVPPELREGMGEVEEAATGRLPRLLDYPDLRGCFHNHTTASDGAATLRELAEAALARGWRYLGIADHSQAAAYAGGLGPEEIRRQHDEIDAWNEERGDELWLFKGLEADILPDGRVDTSAEGGLEGMDYVVASVHSSFGLSAEAQTERLVKALEDPHVSFLGHATGRLLLRRDGLPVDMDAVLSAAAAEGKGIEINASPRRLELDWRWWRRARSLGVPAVVNPDAHSIRELDNLEYGVGVARKGGLGPADVVNAWELPEVRRWLAARRP